MAVQVAVCGPNTCSESESAHAFEVGRLLAEHAAVVICGGGSGVMAAVANGARSRGGLVVGVRPDADRAKASDDLSVAIMTDMGEARNAIIVRSADAVIVIGGSWGTLSELALAKRRGGVPVITLGGWRVLDEHGAPVAGIAVATSPAEAVALALEGAAG